MKKCHCCGALLYADRRLHTCPFCKEDLGSTVLTAVSMALVTLVGICVTLLPPLSAAV